MPEDANSIRSSPDLRIEAVEAFLDLADELFVIGNIPWADAMERDFRPVAVNAAFRRQLESIRATVVLTRQGMGHLGVAFIRAALEEVMYLKFFLDLEEKAAQRLFLLFGSWDSLRSVLAQRAYAGDDVMRELWFTDAFLDGAKARKDETREALKAIQKEYGWSGGWLPAGDWVADRAGERKLYDYLHAASSRAVHFSAGEVMRRAWGNPGGEITTERGEFHEHLAEFALHQLVLLFFQTWGVLDDPAAAGITLNDDVSQSEVETAIQRIASLGQVPLVHAAEWNLTPNGPLDSAD